MATANNRQLMEIKEYIEHKEVEYLASEVDGTIPIHELGYATDFNFIASLKTQFNTVGLTEKEIVHLWEDSCIQERGEYYDILRQCKINDFALGEYQPETIDSCFSTIQAGLGKWDLFDLYDHSLRYDLGQIGSAKYRIAFHEPVQGWSEDDINLESCYDSIWTYLPPLALFWLTPEDCDYSEGMRAMEEREIFFLKSDSHCVLGQQIGYLQRSSGGSWTATNIIVFLRADLENLGYIGLYYIKASAVDEFFERIKSSYHYKFNMGDTRELDEKAAEDLSGFPNSNLGRIQNPPKLLEPSQLQSAGSSADVHFEKFSAYQVYMRRGCRSSGSC